MSIDVLPIRPAGDEPLVQIEQTVDMILDIERSKRPRGVYNEYQKVLPANVSSDNPIPRPVPHYELVCNTSKPYHSDDTCYPLEKTSESEWSLSQIFGYSVKGACHISEGQSAEEVCIRVPAEREVFVNHGASERRSPDNLSRCFGLQESGLFDLTLPEQEIQSHVPLDESILHAERTIIGRGQEKGGMRVIFGNPSNTSSVEFIYFETLPWFIRPYMHTLQAAIAGRDGVHRHVPISNLIKETYYRPAIDRERGTQLELALSVPASSTVTLIYDFEKAILRYIEYPPDANRGFNVAPAVIKVLRASEDGPIFIRTTSLLLPLPTPDFSMPYNVIILTSTVIALAFGSIFNMLVRRFVDADEAGVLLAQTFKGRISGIAIRDLIRGKREKVE